MLAECYSWGWLIGTGYTGAVIGFFFGMAATAMLVAAEGPKPDVTPEHHMCWHCEEEVLGSLPLDERVRKTGGS